MEPAPSGTRTLVRRFVPFPVRLELARLRRAPRSLVERASLVHRRLEPAEVVGFGWLLADHASPLERVPGFLPSELQRGKEANVRRAAELLDGLVIEPNQVFSHHRAIGRPARRRGFREGLEMHDAGSTSGVGGGLCQVSNAFHWIALRAGMRIVERHRHGLDLFPDHARTVPFGCGATVVYNYADFRFENPLSVPVAIRARVRDGSFVGELRTTEDPGIRVEVTEVDHRFFRGPDGWMRENRLRRRITRPDGALLVDQEVAHNLGRVMYEPTEEQLT